MLTEEPQRLHVKFVQNCSTWLTSVSNNTARSSMPIRRTSRSTTIAELSGHTTTGGSLSRMSLFRLAPTVPRLPHPNRFPVSHQQTPRHDELFVTFRRDKAFPTALQDGSQRCLFASLAFSPPSTSHRSSGQQATVQGSLSARGLISRSTGAARRGRRFKWFHAQHRVP